MAFLSLGDFKLCLCATQACKFNKIFTFWKIHKSYTLASKTRDLLESSWDLLQGYRPYCKVYGIFLVFEIFLIFGIFGFRDHFGFSDLFCLLGSFWLLKSFWEVFGIFLLFGIFCCDSCSLLLWTKPLFRESTFKSYLGFIEHTPMKSNSIDWGVLLKKSRQGVPAGGQVLSSPLRIRPWCENFWPLLVCDKHVIYRNIEAHVVLSESVDDLKNSGGNFLLLILFYCHRC